MGGKVSTTAPLVIVGTGLAGYNLAKEFRKLDAERPLMLISADDGRLYSKPLLSTGFAKGKQADELAMQDAASMAGQLQAEILTQTRVERIDPQQRRLWLAERELEYSDLVLACGASPRQLPWARDLGERLLSINDLQDYARFRQALEGRKRVLIIGAGLIGCEFANDLVLAGFEVSVLASDPYLMPGLIPEPVAEPIQASLEALGVRFYLNRNIAQMQLSASGLQVRLDDGLVLEADQGLSAIGLQANTRLAAEAGLMINRGIVVDRQLRSSDPHVFALGDCAEVNGLNLMYVMPLMAGARTLAQVLAGQAAQLSYGPMPVTVKTPACPLVVAPPVTASAGAWTFSGEGLDRRALFHAPDGQLHGYALTAGALPERLQLNRQLPSWL